MNQVNNNQLNQVGIQINPNLFNMNNPLFLQYFQQMNLMPNFNQLTSLKNINLNNKKGKKIIEPNPMDLKFYKDLSNDSISFIVYKSINDNIYLVYSNKNNSIISYDLIDNKKTIEIKNGHNDKITFLRHYLDKSKKRDLILSMSEVIKVWNSNNFECLLKLSNIYRNSYFLFSACFIKDFFYDICIIPCYLEKDYNNDKLKVYNLYGTKIKEINDSSGYKQYSSSIETFYDEKSKITYIITTHYMCVKSYDYYSNQIYHKYIDGNNDFDHHHSIIYNKNEDTLLIEDCADQMIRIWNFHSGELIKKFRIYNLFGLKDICIYNDKYLLATCFGRIELIDLEMNTSNNKLDCTIKEFNGHNQFVITVKIFDNPKYGKCMFSLDSEGTLKLWVQSE